jgi:hypothetical protein
MLLLNAIYLSTGTTSSTSSCVRCCVVEHGQIPVGKKRNHVLYSARVNK